MLTNYDTVTQWFYENYITLNIGKSHFMCRGKNAANEIFIFKNLVMKNSKPKTKNTWVLLKTAN